MLMEQDRKERKFVRVVETPSFKLVYLRETVKTKWVLVFRINRHAVDCGNLDRFETSMFERLLYMRECGEPPYLSKSAPLVEF